MPLENEKRLSRIGIVSVRLVESMKTNNSAWKLKQGKQKQTSYMCMNLQSKPNWFVAATTFMRNKKNSCAKKIFTITTN